MCVDKFFDLSKKDIDKHFSAEDYLLIQNQKDPEEVRLEVKKEPIETRRKTLKVEQELLRKINTLWDFSIQTGKNQAEAINVS